jgi:hypothetical protein
MSFHCFFPFSFENKTKLVFFVLLLIIKLYKTIACCKAPLIKLKSISSANIKLGKFVGYARYLILIN